MATSLTTPNVKRLAATIAILIVVLTGAVGIALAQTSSAKHTTGTGIDFRRTETLAWSLELDRTAPDALHDVTCIHVTGDRYECIGKDTGETTQILHIVVAHDGGWWQTYNDGSGR